MQRRAFLHRVLAFFGVTALVSFGYPLLRFFAPPGAETRIQKVTLQKSEVPPGETKTIVVNAMSVFVINRAGKGFIALSRVCTHLGCLVEYDKAKNRLLCPCHAGVYDLDGTVVSGPPPKPLPKLPLKVEGETIVIG